MATAHTAHCVVTEVVPCLSMLVSCARFERVTNVLKQYVSAGQHCDRDSAPAPVCPMTQLDIWPSTRENKRMLWRNPRAGGFLHHGHARRNEIHRTTSDPKPATGSSCTCGDWHERSRLSCPCVQTSAEKKKKGCHNSTVRINTESFFRVACTSSVRLSSGIRDKSNIRGALLTSESCGFPTSSEHVSCVHRPRYLQSCPMCLQCASSERDLSSADEKTVSAGILLIDLQLPMVHSASVPL